MARREPRDESRDEPQNDTRHASRQDASSGGEARDESGRQDRRYYELRTLTSRAWGTLGAGDDSFGPRELGGYGDFRETRQHGGGAGRDRDRDRDRHRERNIGSAQRGGGQRGRGPAQVRGDTSIADEVYQRLTDDERIDAREVLLAVSDGIVTLTGEVPERAMKRLAEDVAAEVRGVRDVENRISIDDGSASFGPAGRPVRSGFDQLGSGFSSSNRTEDAWRQSSIRHGRAGPESDEPEQQAARRRDR